MFGQKRAEPQVTAQQRQAVANDLIEGRRMCSGCFLYFVPRGTEHTCSAGCADKARRWQEWRSKQRGLRRIPAAVRRWWVLSRVRRRYSRR